MPKLKVQAFSMSIDGHGAGPDQSLENPLGLGGRSLHEWYLHTRSFQQMVGGEGGSTGVDEDFAQRSFANIGVPDGHHQISHHDEDPEKLRKIALIDRFYLRQLGYFLDKLKSIKEGDGTLLDHSMIVYGGGISDPNRHDHSKLPVILAGRANGTLNPGRHIVASNDGELPMTNLYLAMLERMGVNAERVGDSTGVLTEI